jgi:hypothetical protein
VKELIHIEYYLITEDAPEALDLLPDLACPPRVVCDARGNSTQGTVTSLEACNASESTFAKATTPLSSRGKRGRCRQRRFAV